jgi:hypothetical protein
MPRRDKEDWDDDRPRRRRRPRDDFDDDERPPRRKKSNGGLIIFIMLGVLIFTCGAGGIGYLLYVQSNYAVQTYNEGIEVEQSRQKLLLIGQGMHAHHNAIDNLPADSRDSQLRGGAKPTYRPLLSWRVHLLPFIGEEALYRRFKLDEPWDSANNLPLLAEMPAVYGAPEANKRAGPGKTYYRGFTHVGAAFENAPPGGPERKLRFADFTDGLGNTLLVVDAAEAVEWTKPDDFAWSEGTPRPGLGGIVHRLPMCHVLFGDGSVRQLRKDVPDRTLRGLIGRQDGMVVPKDWEFKDY